MLSRVLWLSMMLVLVVGLLASPDFSEVAAGVAIFLFGMLQLEKGFRVFTGGILESVLARTTNTLGKSLLSGFAVTSLVQSSSLVSLIAISFISAGMITLASGIGIVFGANIGTTTGAWLVAAFGLKVNISTYAMPLLVLGVVLHLHRSESLRGAGSILAGLGFLFLGIHYMKEGFETFGNSLDIADFALPGYAGLFVFTAIGAVATVVMQSSHATLVLILSALLAGQIDYENALALAIGANVGTTVTALLGAIGASIEGKRLALAHLAFNLITAVLAIVLITPLSQLVESLSAFLGIGAEDHLLKLALFHTLFNVMGVGVMLPFVSRLAALLKRMLPQPRLETVEPMFLNDAALEYPDSAVLTVRNEVWHLFDCAFEILAHGIHLKRHQIESDTALTDVVRSSHQYISVDYNAVYERKVKVLFGAIVLYTSRAQNRLTGTFAEDLFQLRTAAADIVKSVKHVKHMAKNLHLYLRHDNTSVQEEYDLMRLRIARVLRAVVSLRAQPDNPLAVLEFDEFKAESTEASVELNRRVNRLLLTGRIDTRMATSIFNDASYAERAVICLSDAAQTLLVGADTAHADAVREVRLDAAEIDALSAQDRTGT